MADQTTQPANLSDTPKLSNNSGKSASLNNLFNRLSNLQNQLSNLQNQKATTSSPTPSTNSTENKPTQEEKNIKAEDKTANNSSNVINTAPTPKVIQDTPDYYIISNIILIQACNEYVEHFYDNYIPFSFLHFYIKELSSYNQYFTEQISNFMVRFFNDPTTELKQIVEMFINTFPTYAKKITKKGKTFYLMLDNSNANLVIDYEISNNDTNFANTRKKLNQILNHYKENDELFTLKELYHGYMRSETIQSYIEKVERKRAKVQPIATPAFPDSKHSSKYDGRETAIIEEKGKVFQLRIPKFALPLKYPLSKTKCLIHREIQLKKLLDAADMINFVNTWQITKIRENQNFIDKRKRLLTPQKSKYESFLDSF